VSLRLEAKTRLSGKSTCLIGGQCGHIHVEGIKGIGGRRGESRVVAGDEGGGRTHGESEVRVDD